MAGCGIPWADDKHRLDRTVGSSLALQVTGADMQLRGILVDATLEALCARGIVMRVALWAEPVTCTRPIFVNRGSENGTKSSVGAA